MNSRNFVIAGLFALVLLLAGALVTSQAEWSGQTWEYMILATDFQPGNVEIEPMLGERSAAEKEAITTAAEALITETFGDTEITLSRIRYPFYLQVAGAHGWEYAGNV